jgi:hypothetical protein
MAALLMVYELQGALPVRFAAPEIGLLFFFPKKLITDAPVPSAYACANNLAKDRSITFVLKAFNIAASWQLRSSESNHYTSQSFAF